MYTFLPTFNKLRYTTTKIIQFPKIDEFLKVTFDILAFPEDLIRLL